MRPASGFSSCGRFAAVISVALQLCLLGFFCCCVGDSVAVLILLDAYEESQVYG
jgi:hypothetical protein